MQYVLRFGIDIIYLVLTGVIILVAVKQGFVETLYRFGKTIFAGIAAFLFGPAVGDLLNDKWIYGWIYRYVSQKSVELVEGAEGAIDVNALMDQLPLLIRRLVTAEDIEEKIGALSGDVKGFALNFSATVSQSASWLISNVIAYISVFLVALLILFLMFRLFEQVVEIPAVGRVNKILGGVFGAVAAVIVLAVITFVLGILASLMGAESTVAHMTDSSLLFKLFDRLIFGLL